MIKNQLRKTNINFHKDLRKKSKDGNFIKTSKYTILSFFPVVLCNQFIQRYANIYFLFIAILQSIPSISPLNPVTAIAPLFFVIGLSMLRELYEDYQRYKSDQIVNNYQIDVLVTNNKDANETVGQINQQLRNGYQYFYNNLSDQFQIHTLKWRDLQPGDIVFIKNDQNIPADIVVLGTALDTGLFYIQTSSLDGEKGLKTKMQNEVLQNNQLTTLQVHFQEPNQNLFEFQGYMTNNNDYNDKILLDLKTFIPRGSVLKNTQFIFGVVVYVGNDTKTMKNTEPKILKTSGIEKFNNSLIMMILIVQLILCLVLSIIFYSFNNINYNQFSYLPQIDNLNSKTVQIYLSYFLLLNTLIPISLVVSIEFTKLFQIIFITNDTLMSRCTAQTSTINEELGQIQSIFSDKTGTLTCNIMEFKIFTINQTLYNYDSTLLTQLFSVNQPASCLLMQDLQQLKAILLQNTDLNQLEPKLQYLYLFMLNMALNHQCVIDSENQEQPIKIADDYSLFKYTGQSPDEITLIEAASSLGFQFQGVERGIAKLMLFNQKIISFQILYNFEFDSDRKRSTVIVQHNNQYIMFIKGADNIIKNIIKLPNQNLAQTDIFLDNFSKSGLRTLCFGFKFITNQQFQIFNQQYTTFYSKQDGKQELFELIKSIENNIDLIGCSAIEDKLQENVQEVIQDILRAEIKLWMLTGDKLETAENIGKSCGLIQNDFQIIKLRERDINEISEKLKEIEEIKKLCIQEKKKTSLIIDGTVLGRILENQEQEQQFNNICQQQESVIVCRSTPKQKAQVVRMVKKYKPQITLSIGDGANDVNMIQAADLGIGIYGNEGLRAAQSSDFAIGQFQDLWRLLFFHGRLNYQRIANMILYFFYKNLLFTLPQFYFAFVSMFSAQSVFDDWYLSFYNMVFTALPLLIRAIFDYDFNYSYLNKNHQLVQDQLLKNINPYLYYQGQKNTILNSVQFLYMILECLFQITVIYVIHNCVLNDDLFTTNALAYSSDFRAASNNLFTSIFFVVSIKIALLYQTWMIFNYISLFLLSIALYILYFFVSNYVSWGHLQYTTIFEIQTPQFYLQVVLSCTFILTYELFKIMIQNNKNNITLDIRNYLNENDEEKRKKLKLIIVKQLKNLINNQNNNQQDIKLKFMEFQNKIYNNEGEEKKIKIKK